jgi:O-6-methylguanine DNA methyltransferase
VNSSTFRSRVLSAVRRIPAGRVATYGDVAALAGSPRASRAVGNIMRECRDRGTPCHRVVAAGGALGGYGGAPHMKRELLRREGLEVRGARIRHFASVRWAPHALNQSRRRAVSVSCDLPLAGPARATLRGRKPV